MKGARVGSFAFLLRNRDLKLIVIHAEGIKCKQKVERTGHREEMVAEVPSVAGGGRSELTWRHCP